MDKKNVLFMRPQKVLMINVAFVNFNIVVGLNLAIWKKGNL